MIIKFTFPDGHILQARTYADTWNIIRAYIAEQTAPDAFIVIARARCLTLGNRPSTYARAKAALRDAAIDWQRAFADYDYSMMDIHYWQGFFRAYGARYGLLTEFRDNGIC